MTARQKENLKQIVFCILEENGYKKDAYGNYKKKYEKGEFRYKNTKIALRYEARLNTGQWMRLRSAYWKDISVTEDNKIAGLKY